MPSSVTRLLATAMLALPVAAMACDTADHARAKAAADNPWLVATAAEHAELQHHHHHHHQDTAPRADGHAPIGVMGEHRHARGEIMLSYRFMSMHMEGNRVRDERIDPDTIATTVPNRFANPPMMPPTLRVVPLEMDMQMHMFGAMYAPSDELTLMLMLPYIQKDMLHRTYQGGMGTNVLGHFVTEAKGLGDASIEALYEVGLARGEAHFNLGLSLPTGETDASDDVLAPNGMTPTLRLPYPMQLGTGTFALRPGLTWYERTGALTLGAQFKASLQLGRNSDDYRHGHGQQISGWASWAFGAPVSVSVRAAYRNQGRIKGQDAAIRAPVQTADPDRQGGERIDLGLGLNLVGQRGALRGQRLALEYLAPVHQSLNGPQLETDSTLIVGWQYAW